MAGAKTSTFTVDEAVTRIFPLVDCRQFTIQPQDGQSDYFLRAPDSDYTQVRKHAGEPTTFPAGLYKAFETIAWAQTISGQGSKTFERVEHQ